MRDAAMVAPKPTTINPEINPSQGYSWSGKMKRDANRVTNPRAKTSSVWVVVTVNPR